MQSRDTIFKDNRVRFIETEIRSTWLPMVGYVGNPRRAQSHSCNRKPKDVFHVFGTALWLDFLWKEYVGNPYRIHPFIVIELRFYLIPFGYVGCVSQTRPYNFKILSFCIYCNRTTVWPDSIWIRRLPESGSIISSLRYFISSNYVQTWFCLDTQATWKGSVITLGKASIMHCLD